jgi:type II secretory pathway component PulF
MPRYRYIATGVDGNRLEGSFEAGGPDEVERRLRAEGLQVESVRVDPSGDGGGSGRLSDLDVTEFTRHVAGLDKAGLPLPSGLRALGDELASGRLRKVLMAMADDLEAGRSLEVAVEAQSDGFPKHLRGLVLAGVRSGKLGETLEQFARYHSIHKELKSKLWLSLAYPLLLIGTLGLLFVFVCRIVANDFSKLFNDFGMDLPPLTKALLNVANAVSVAGPWLIVGLVGVLVAVWLLGVSLGGAGWRHGLTTPIPLIGPLWRWTTLVEFAQLLALLVESETPLPMALQLTGEGIRDADVSRSCRGMRRLVEAGLPLSDAMERMQPFPVGLPRILRWAEASHSLPGALHLAAEMYEARARAQARFVGVACTMITVILVVCGASLLVLALFLPLIQLISRLSG